MCDTYDCPSATHISISNAENVSGNTQDVCCTGIQCIQPTTEGYVFSGITDSSVTMIPGFSVNGITCSAGYMGETPTATVCTADNTTYSVTGCTEIENYCSNNNDSNLDYDCGDFHNLKTDSDEITCENTCSTDICCIPRTDVTITTVSGSVVIPNIERFENIIEGIENTDETDEIVETNCTRIKTDILTDLNLTSEQIVFRCSADSSGKYDFSFDILSSDERPISDFVKKKIDEKTITALGQSLDIEIENENTKGYSWGIIAFGIFIASICSIILIVILSLLK
jgi:hypothetical protein